MKLLNLLLGFLSIEFSFIELVFDHKFTQFECQASDKNTCVKPFCYITSTVTSLSLANCGCTITRPLKELNFTLKQYRKTGKGYREIFKTPTIDWNDAINGKKLNPFLEITLDMMKKAAPSIFRKFPWTGKFEIYNLTIESYKFFSIFPKGDYKSVFWFGDGEDEIIFKGTLISTLTTIVEV